MPEIKNQFTGGKMNKDVDERLVPKGEYRDAMNIQVSTSEGSDVGTVQNILGNSLVSGQSFIDNDTVCVGAVTDEKNDKLYYFITQKCNHTWNFNNNGDEWSVTGGNYSGNQWTFSNGQAVGTSGDSGTMQVAAPGVVDGKKYRITYDIIDPSVGGLILANHTTNASTLNSVAGSSNVGLIRENTVGTHTIEWEQGPAASRQNSIWLWNNDDYTGTIDNISVRVMDKDMIVEYDSKTDQVTPVFIDEFGDILKFDPNNIITGINIVDDMLFWTDGKTEPKKINIPRSIEGTDSSGLMHTRLINKVTGVDFNSNIPIQEEHITVIRKSPSKQPTLSHLISNRAGVISGTTDSIDFTSGSGALLPDGSKIKINIEEDINDNPVDFKAGDILRLIEDTSSLSPPENYTARVRIEREVIGSTVPVGHTRYKVEIVTLSNENPDPSVQYAVALEENTDENLFQRKFPRFAYRYKYIDNEYSSIGPFSEVAFIPGHFSYHPTEAYNKGMVNNLKKLTLQDFIPSDIPKDVIQVDLLYKNEINPNIYVIKSITKDDAAWNADGSSPDTSGSYDVVTENIHRMLPSNQLLRHWDNVPRSALSQEITGNRIVYGNYTQGYDYSFSKTSYSPEIEAEIGVRPDHGGSGAGQKSIKSSRTYDLGIVYGDEFGRETPVFTASPSTQIVSKSNSKSSNILNVSLGGNPPLWADYCKVFIKETSNEYYNLAVDRVYDALDGNVWISFPSVDRNKVDEDTYLVLKKGIENVGAVLEEARYKVVAIENEAPDYIKTNYTLVSEPNQNIHGYSLLGGNSPPSSAAMVASPAEAPEVGHTSFTIHKGNWSNPYSVSNNDMGLTDLETLMSEIGADDLYVAFSNRVTVDSVHTKRVSSKYLVTGISGVPTGTGVNGWTGAALYKVSLAKAIPQSDDWITTTLALNYVDGGQLKPHFYRRRVESKPEFEGRFFVKIIEDDTIRTKVKPIEKPKEDWMIMASEPLSYLIDSDVLSSPNPPATNATRPLPTANTGNTASVQRLDWKDNLKFGTGSIKSRWFIDHAFYAGKQPNDESHIGLSISDGLDQSLYHTSFSTSLQWSDQQNIASGIVISDTGGIGRSTGRVHSDGLFEDTNTGDTYFHLSYSTLKTDKQGVLENGHWWPHEVWTVGNEDGQTSGTPTNAFTENQIGFVSHLKLGSFFRIEGDDNVYRISSTPYAERLYNYMGYLQPFSAINPTHVNEIDVYNQIKADMTRDENKRLRWTIKYELYEPGDTPHANLADNPAMTVIDRVNEGYLEFVKPFEAQEDNVISTNPAIFETEPKEEVDIDIYYEASSNIPTLPLNNRNKHMFLPIGSKLIPSHSLLVAFPNWNENISISSWYNIDESNPSYIVSIYPQIPNYAISGINSWDEYKDSAEIHQAKKPSGDIVSFEIGNVINAGLPAQQWVAGFHITPLPETKLDWFNCWSFNNGVESNRIGDTYNKPFITNGVKASMPLLDQYKEEHKKYGLIYSGLYNSNSGVNNLNQFIAAEKITKDINPIYGSIQKLHAGWGQGGDLVALCEDRVLKILANKDALFNADGNVNITSTNAVLGATMPYSGEYGISKNPESFASEAYRLYFTDKVRGTVMRLSRDGLTPISMHGMKDWFRDNLKLSNTLIGSYDDKKDEYNITLKDRSKQTSTTTSTINNSFFSWTGYVDVNGPADTLIGGSSGVEIGDVVVVNTVGWGVPVGTSVTSVTTIGGATHITMDNLVQPDGVVAQPWQFEVTITGYHNITTYNTTTLGTQLTSKTVTFREDVKGWVSFKSFTPENAISCANEYFTFDKGKIWKHHEEQFNAQGKEINRNTFYNVHNENHYSTLNVILNDVPGSVKSFSTINYEGSQSKVKPFLSSVTDDYGNTIPLTTDNQYYNLGPAKPGWHVDSIFTNKESGSLEEFIEKEGKWFNYIKGKNVQTVFDSGSTLTHVSMESDGSSSFDQASFAIQGIGILGSPPGPPILYGCTDQNACNYDAAAQVDDGSCFGCIPGCTNPAADNYNVYANVDDGTCYITGCTCPPITYLDGCTNYDPTATVNCNGCCIATVYGCTNPLATNFNPLANTNQVSATNSSNPCSTAINGCMEPTANTGYDPTVTNDDGTCKWFGCTDPTANNYLWEGPTVDSLATVESWAAAGGNSPSGGALSYVPLSASHGMQLTSSTICTYNSGCTDPSALNYDPTAVTDDGSCSYCNWNLPGGTYSTNGGHIYTTNITNASVSGAYDGAIAVYTAPNTGNYSPPMAVDDGSGNYVYSAIKLLDNNGTVVDHGGPFNSGVYTFSNLLPGSYHVAIYANYTIPGGWSAGGVSTTLVPTPGCVWNSFVSATGFPITVATSYTCGDGCMDDGSNPTFYETNHSRPLSFSGAAWNYDANACTEDGSCCYISGCTDPLALNYDFACHDNGSCCYVGGCIDPTASNYDPSACIDDLSCTYSIVYGCMDSRPRNDLAIGNSGIYVKAALNYDPAATRNETSATDASNPCLYNTDVSLKSPSLTGGSGAYGSNFFYTSTTDNWLSRIGGSNDKHTVFAIWDVSSLPLIQWPGYDSGGSPVCNFPSSPGCIAGGATSGARFSYDTARTGSSCQGNLTSYYGGVNQGSGVAGFRWYYSTDNGHSWEDGNTITQIISGIPHVGGNPQAIELVRFHFNVNSTCSSGRIDWTSLPTSYNGKFKQKAIFGFLDWDWTPPQVVGGLGAPSPTPVTETISDVNYQSESATVKTGCKAGITNSSAANGKYCNTSGYLGNAAGVNFPTHPTYNPCQGTPICASGHNSPEACNAQAGAPSNCHDQSLCQFPQNNWYHGPSSTCSGTISSGCFVDFACDTPGTSNTCNGYAYPSITACCNNNPGTPGCSSVVS